MSYQPYPPLYHKLSQCYSGGEWKDIEGVWPADNWKEAILNYIPVFIQKEHPYGLIYKIVSETSSADDSSGELVLLSYDGLTDDYLRWSVRATIID